MLPVGTILHDTYHIDSYLSSGGFGNTYVVTHIAFNETYAVKEFFMRGVTQRDGYSTTVSVSNQEKVEEFNSQREKFKKEALRLRKLNNKHIVRVHDLFEENGTAYYVMDYIDGESLKERLARTKQPLSESEVNKILPQILDALNEVHSQNIWHLDLKPANIMLDKQGTVKLIDFGASKQFNVQKGGATTSTAVSYTNGYAPREQMEQSYEKFGPWTDFYALGATLYNLLSNQRPPLPTDIDDDLSKDKHLALPLPSGVSEKMKSLVLWLMKTNRQERPASVQKIQDYMKRPSFSDSEIKGEKKPSPKIPQKPTNLAIDDPAKITGWFGLFLVIVFITGIVVSCITFQHYYNRYGYLVLHYSSSINFFKWVELLTPIIYSFILCILAYIVVYSFLRKKTDAVFLGFIYSIAYLYYAFYYRGIEAVSTFSCEVLLICLIFCDISIIYFVFSKRVKRLIPRERLELIDYFMVFALIVLSPTVLINAFKVFL